MTQKAFRYSCPGCGFAIEVLYPYPPTCPLCGGQLVRQGNILASTSEDAGGNKKQSKKGRKKNGKAEI